MSDSDITTSNRSKPISIMYKCELKQN